MRFFYVFFILLPSQRIILMPLIDKSEYKAPFWLINEHWETILPAMLRKPRKPFYTRARINTQDGDFLDLDYVRHGHEKILILSHGLEGHSFKAYVTGMANKFLKNQWDVLAWNCRSCSGEMNRTPKLYHHGATEDLETVVNHTIKKGYKSIVLIGFSLGGSLTIKYFGERGEQAPPQVAGGVAFSVPVQLAPCARELSKPENKVYLNRFLRKLKKKIKLKAKQFPKHFPLDGIDVIDNFYDFDDKISAPLYNFISADDFYNYASAGNYIAGIKRPVLLVNALNDPMLPDECFPYELAKNHEYFYLETPAQGGHVGFWRPGQRENWAEKRAQEFVIRVIGAG